MHSHGVVTCAVLLGMAAAGSAAPAQEAAPAPAAPPPNVYAPLVRRLDLGGQIRLRAEARDAADYRRPGTFGRPAADGPGDNDDLILERSRLHADVAVDDRIRVFLQIQDSRVWGQEASVTANDVNLGVHQSYVDIKGVPDPAFLFRLGRQELSYGAQRLVSPLDWSVTGRVFDAALARWSGDTWTADLFTSIVAEGDTSNHDRDFHGLFVTCKAVAGHTFDAYAFHRRFTDETAVSEAGLPGDLADTTAGARAAGKSDPFDYSLEAAFQKGAVARDPVSAWAAAAAAGVTFGDAPWKPRVGLELDHASGDRDATDGRRQSFDPLFPFGHAYQGHLDIFSWRNGTDAVLQLSGQPAAGVTLALDVHSLRLAQDEDAWYGATATPLRRDATGKSGRSVGTEADLYVKWKAFDRVALWAGYSRFRPGSYVRQTGASPPMDWFFVQATLDF